MLLKKCLEIKVVLIIGALKGGACLSQAHIRKEVGPLNDIAKGIICNGCAFYAFSETIHELERKCTSKTQPEFFGDVIGQCQG